MSIDRLPLSKLLELLQRPRDRRITEIERDAKKSVMKERFGLESGGGDFYSAFWADAKQSVIDAKFDLPAAVATRIAANRQKARLYPRLLSGFRNGWSSIRNSVMMEGPLKLIDGLTGKLFETDDAVVRVEKLMTIRDSAGRLVITYPYFCKDVPLGGRHARLGLAALQRAIRPAEGAETSIMDVLRGKSFAANDTDFSGDECDRLDERYGQMMHEWRVQRRIHGGT